MYWNALPAPGWPPQSIVRLLVWTFNECTLSLAVPSKAVVISGDAVFQVSRYDRLPEIPLMSSPSASVTALAGCLPLGAPKCLVSRVA